MDAKGLIRSYTLSKLLDKPLTNHQAKIVFEFLNNELSGLSKYRSTSGVSIETLTYYAKSKENIMFYHFIESGNIYINYDTIWSKLQLLIKNYKDIVELLKWYIVNMLHVSGIDNVNYDAQDFSNITITL
jgi:hypothetical protein